MSRPPYEQIALPLADELQVWMNAAGGRSRNSLSLKVGLPLGTFNNILSGWRRPTYDVLSHLLFLARGEDYPGYKERLRFYSGAYRIQPEERTARRKTPAAAESLSRTHRLRLGRNPLRIGVVDFAPWAMSAAGRPEGLIPDLLEMLTGSMGIESEWSVLPLGQVIEAVVNGDVDIAAGYICRTPVRTTRTVFVPLGIPAELGIQAITRARIPARLTGYNARREWLEAEARAGRLSIVMVEGELAWDYRRSLLSAEVPIRSDGAGLISDAIQCNWQRTDAVIFTDHVTSGAAIARSQSEAVLRPFHSLYANNIGSFGGGFLLPVNDREFLKFFELSWQHLLTSRMPGVGETLSRYASAIKPFLTRTTGGETMANWVDRCWPAQIPIPSVWRRILSEGKRHA